MLEASQITKSLQSMEYTEQVLDDGEDGAQDPDSITSQQDARFVTDCKSRMEGADAGLEVAEVDSSNRISAADEACH